MIVVDLSAFRVARAMKMNGPDVDVLLDSDLYSQAAGYAVRLSEEAAWDDEEARAAAVQTHRARTGWTGPVIVAPEELTKEEWIARQAEKKGAPHE